MTADDLISTHRNSLSALYDKIVLHLSACALLGDGVDARRVVESAALVDYLVKNGFSINRIADECASRGFRRSSMWFRRRFPSSDGHGC